MQNKEVNIKSNPESLLENLLKCELKNGKTNHVFICYSKASREFAKSIQNYLTGLSDKLFVCNHEENFIPGRSILQNITASIRESIKVVLVLSETFIKSQWCNYEAECTLCLKLDMKESKTIIPLLTDEFSVENTPDFLQALYPIKCTVETSQWHDQLLKALNTEIKLWQLIMKPLPLQEGKIYHFVTFEDGSKCDQIIQILQRLTKDEFRGKKFSLNDLVTAESFKVIQDVVDALNGTIKVLIFSNEQLNINRFYVALIKMVKMYIEDNRVTTTSIIPINLDGTSFPILGESITFLDVGREEEFKYFDRLKDAIGRTNEPRFRFPYEADIIFNNRIYRVADFECSKADDDIKNPRILDICCMEICKQSYLVLIDANNMKIKMASIYGDWISNAYTFPKRPNRLSKINDNSLAIIYENSSTIDLLKLEEDKSFILTKRLSVGSDIIQHIKGIVALTENYFLLTNGSKCFIFEDGKLKGQDESPTMSLARRFAKAMKNNYIFIADENDRRLIWLDKDGTVLHAQEKWNSSLYNVRGIAASDSKIYAAVSNAVLCFNYNVRSDVSNSTPYSIDEADRIIRFQRPVDHNRAICLNNTGQYLVLSQVIDEKDHIRIFRLHS